jgi:hypothetical protein
MMDFDPQYFQKFSFTKTAYGIGHGNVRTTSFILVIAQKLRIKLISGP